MNTIKKRNREKTGIRITKADSEILEVIAKRGFQTYGELREKILREYNRQHSWDILKRLVHYGYLYSVKSDCDRILGWRINPKRQMGKNVLSGTNSRAPKIISYPTSFKHDLYLRKIEDRLNEAKAIHRWIPEHELRKTAMEKFAFLTPEARRRNLTFVPDALLELKVENKLTKAALELEMTRKSERQIYEKLEKYIIGQDFQFAFYIVRGESLLEVIKRVYNTVMTKSLHVKVAKSWNGIYFAGLDEVLTNGIHAKFDGRKNSLSFAEIG